MPSVVRRKPFGATHKPLWFPASGASATKRLSPFTISASAHTNPRMKERAEELMVLAVLGLVLLSSSTTHATVYYETNTGSDDDSHYLGPASCSAHPACAHLVGDCCPTAPYGKHLDCCHGDAAAATEAPYDPVTAPQMPPYTSEDPYQLVEEQQPPHIFLGGGPGSAAACGLHPGCAGLEGNDDYDDCCPSPSGYDLPCCHATSPIETLGYQRDFTLYGHAELDQNHAQYLTSTGQHYEQVDAKGAWYVEYQRNIKVQYDMIYYTTDAIPNAYDYVTGQRKFYLTVEATSATILPAACTQIYLQLDSLPQAQPYNYPVGRHSRYRATVPPNNDLLFGAQQQQQQGTRRTVVLQFDYLDSPEEDYHHHHNNNNNNNNNSDHAVNAIALFFDPGAFSQSHWVWHSLDSYTACSATDDDGVLCRPSPPQRCPALYEECGPDDTCDNPQCLLAQTPPPGESSSSSSCSIEYASSFLALEDRGSTAAATTVLTTSSAATTTTTTVGNWMSVVTLLCCWAAAGWVVLV